MDLMSKLGSWVVKTLAGISIFYILILGFSSVTGKPVADAFDRAGALALGALIGSLGDPHRKEEKSGEGVDKSNQTG